METLNLTGSDPLAVRASRRLRAQDGLMTAYAATLLRMELDRVPLWRGDHVSVSQLAEDFARYLYLPRLKGPEVLLRTIEGGVSLITWSRRPSRSPKSSTKMPDTTVRCASRIGSTCPTQVLRDCSSSLRRPGSSSIRYFHRRRRSTPTATEGQVHVTETHRIAHHRLLGC